MELKNCTFLQVKGGARSVSSQLKTQKPKRQIGSSALFFAGCPNFSLQVVQTDIALNKLSQFSSRFSMKTKVDSMMIIIFVIIIHIILNEKGAFVINLINILIILITMMTVIRFAINIDVVMMVFMKSCLDQTQT